MELPKYYDMLAEKIHFIPINGLPFQSIAREIVNFTKNEKGNSIALVDTEFNVKQLEPLLNMAKDMRSIKRRNINSFKICKGWLIRKYFAFEPMDQVFLKI